MGTIPERPTCQALRAWGLAGAAVGLAAMVVSAWQAWAVVYVLGAVAAVVGLWPLARSLATRLGVATRLGSALLVLAAVAAVGLPAFQAWRLYDGAAQWSVDRFSSSGYFDVGGLLEDERRPVVIVAADGSWRNLDVDFVDYFPDDPEIRGIAPGVGALVMADGEHAFWYRWGHDVPTPLVDRLVGYDTWQVDAMTDSAVVLSGCPEDAGEACLVVAHDIQGEEIWSLEVPGRAGVVRRFASEYSWSRWHAVPEVVVTGDGPWTVRDPATGDALGEYPGTGGVLTGDLLVATQPAGQECHLTAARGADVEWEATITTSACETPNLTGDFIVFLGDQSVVTVDLATGEAYPQPAGRWEDAEAIVDATAVFEEGEEVFGIDLRTGEEAWRWAPDGEGWLTDAGSGHVLTVTHPRTWNPFISSEVREDGWFLHLLDAETGEVVVRVLYPETIWSSTVVDGGFAIVEDNVVTMHGDPPPDPRPEDAR